MKKCGHCETLGEAGTVCMNCGGRGCHDTDTALPVYNVRIIETVTYLFPVEAENVDAAESKAEEDWYNVEDHNQYFENIEERVIDGVVK